MMIYLIICLPSLGYCVSADMRQPRKHLHCGDQVMIVIRAGALSVVSLTRDIFVRREGKKKKKKQCSSSDQTPRLTFADNSW